MSWEVLGHLGGFFAYLFGLGVTLGDFLAIVGGGLGVKSGAPFDAKRSFLHLEVILRSWGHLGPSWGSLVSSWTTVSVWKLSSKRLHVHHIFRDSFKLARFPFPC